MTVREERSNQLNYVPTCRINEMRNRQYLRGLARFAYRAPVALDCPKRARFLAQPPEIVASVCALAMCKKKPARSAPNDPSCHHFGSHRQQNLNKPLAQKYPNSFSQITKGREAATASAQTHYLTTEIIQFTMLSVASTSIHVAHSIRYPHLDS